MKSRIRNELSKRVRRKIPKSMVPGSLALLVLCLSTSAALAQLTDLKAEDCADRMTRTFIKKGWVGITPGYDDSGLIIVDHVFSDSPAEKAGIRKGDIVRGLNGQDRKSCPQEFRKEYDSLRPNQSTDFDIERDGVRLSITVLVEPIPESVLRQWIEEECEVRTSQ